MSDSFVLSVDINCTEHGLHVGVMPVLQNIKRNALLKKKKTRSVFLSLCHSVIVFSTAYVLKGQTALNVTV